MQGIQFIKRAFKRMRSLKNLPHLFFQLIMIQEDGLNILVLSLCLSVLFGFSTKSEKGELLYEFKSEIDFDFFLFFGFKFWCQCKIWGPDKVFTSSRFWTY